MSDGVLLALDIFGQTAKSVTNVNDKEKKGVWKINTDNDIFYLKKTPLDEPRLRFVLAAWRHLIDGGIGLPSLVLTPTGENYAIVDGSTYILMTSVAGRSPKIRSTEDKCNFMRFLAQFHQASKYFNPPTNCSVHSLLGSLSGYYAKKFEELQFYREDAKKRKSPFAEQFLMNVPRFTEAIERARMLLAESSYDTLCQDPTRWVLAHQDFAPGNVTHVVDDRWYVLDMDALAFDLPYRDIRKVFNKIIKKSAGWDGETILSMLKAYQEVNPLDSGDLKILWADLQFPHLFCGLAAKYFQGREKDWSEGKYLERMEMTLRSEINKEEILLESFTEIIRQITAPGIN